MALLVEHKGAPFHGRSKQGYPKQSSPPVRSVPTSKARERQKMSKLKSSGSLVAPDSGVTGAELNMIAVQKVDPHVRDMLSTVPQVVLYRYEAGSNVWERTSTEGTLFIYSRNGYPGSGFVLLNRLSSDNLQEMVGAGSEYRVQDVFVLFKDHSDASKIYGLCFNDATICADTGKLLNSLSSQTLTDSNGFGTYRGEGISVSMRSHSVPTLPHTQDVVTREKGELLENAGNPYHNQMFSDDAGSSGQESPPSEAICFTANPLTSSQHNDEDQSASGGRNHSSPSSTRHEKGNAAREKSGLKRSTPRTIPKLVNMNAASSPPSTSRAPSQSSSSHHVHSQVRYSSRVAGTQPKQTQNSRLLHSTAVTTTSGATHAPKTATAQTPKQETGRTPLRSSTAPSHVTAPSRRKQTPTKAGTPAVKHSNKGHASAGPLQEVVPEPSLARQLFEPEPLREKSKATTTESGSVHLQHLFSQAPVPQDRNRVLATTGSGLLSVAAIQPLLLAEIEKQMSDEVPSPDRTVTFSLAHQHPAPPSSSVSAHTTGTPPTTAVTTHTAPPGSGEDKVQLLQPSSFSATQSRANASPLTTRGSTTTTGDGKHEVTSLSLAVEMVLPSFMQQSSTSGTVAVNVDPPTPVVTSSKMVHFGRINDGAFPDIPPLMHSPGMQAPPVSRGRSSVQQYKQRETAVGCSKETPKRTHKMKGGEVQREGRSEGVSGSPVEAEGTPSPQPGVPLDVNDTPSRSWSVPSNMSPMSVVVPPHPSSQPHTLLSPQQFSISPDTATQTPQQTDLSREHFRHALIHLIQNDDDFFSRIFHAYHLSVAQQLQQF